MKKSELQALVNQLPSEFAPEEFQSAFNTLVAEQIPEWQVAEAFKTAERTRREGASSLSEFKERFETWADTLE